MKYTKIIMSGLVALTATTNAMPTQAETKKVEPLVMDLMRADQAALKSGKKTRVEVAESAMELADKAESEAAKLLLMKGAFNLYVRAGEFDKAIETLQTMQTTISDMPLANMVNIIESSLRVVSRKNGGQLYRLLDDTKTRLRYTNEATALEKSVKKSPADHTLRTRLAEHYAYLGKWDLALENFAATDGKVGAVAKSEREGKAATEKVADFWWNYPTGKADELVRCFRTHAAKLYEDAITAGDIKGLNKVQAERRIEESKGYGENVFDGTSISVGSVLSGNKFVKVTSNTIVVSLPENEVIEFVKIKPGKFPMVVDGKGTVEEAVITRPYWISKGPITYGQYHALVGEWIHQSLTNVIAKYGIGRNGVVGHGSWCNEKVIDSLTKLLGHIDSGYVLRLPSDAEWQYAARGGTNKKGNPWVMAVEGRVPGDKRNEICDRTYGRNNREKKIDSLMKKTEKDKDFHKRWVLDAFIDVERGGTNGYGLYGLFQNREMLLDAYQRKDLKSVDPLTDWHENDTVSTWPHPKTMVDPFVYDMGTESETYRRFSSIIADHAHNGFGVYARHGKAFRLVIGPDLVSEWKARNNKK